jgi:hypothetical protein
MRATRWILVFVGVIGLGIAATASADRSDMATVATVDISPVRDELVVLRGNEGHYVAIVPFELSSKHFYFGTKERMYRQQTFLNSVDEGTTIERVFWSPRSNNDARIEFKDGTWTLQCGERETVLNLAANLEADRLLASAKFQDRRWNREAYLLGRDKSHNYYYLDHEVGAQGSAGFRLFVGRKGAMKRVKLTTVVRDTEGEVFATSRGELHVISTGDSHRPVLSWKRRDKTGDLVTVPVERNSYLIYEELGVYRGMDLGTPCDYY